LALTGGRAQDFGVLYFFLDLCQVVLCPMVAALSLCRWSLVVRLGVASRRLGAGVFLGLVVCGWFPGLVQAVQLID